MGSTAEARTQTLRETSHRLNQWLDGIQPTKDRPRSKASPEQIEWLLSELLSTGAVLRSAPLPEKGIDPEFDRQCDAYRQSVEKLRTFLPSIHGQLLAERARIEAQRSRLDLAAEWARASRQVL